MIERYALSPLKEMWSERARFGRWLEVEVAALRAREELGELSRGVADRVAGATIDVDRINELERTTNHDVVAFIESITEQLDPADAAPFHTGLTSSDIIDTAQALVLRDATRLILHQTEQLRDAIVRLARRHRDTLTVGRSHGIHAEPTSFGLKLLGFAAETERNVDRLRVALDEVSHAKVSGSVGNYANVSPRLEELMMRMLGLRACKVSTQIVPRDHHAAFLSTLALLGGGIERLATETRHLQRTELSEAAEAFGRGQKGSSSMPHKKNPIVGERLTGLARLLRGWMVAAHENIALWHERDISHSSVERYVFPDATMTAYYMVVQARRLVEGLVVDRARMRENTDATRGLLFTQRLMIALIGAGHERQASYDHVQQLALAAWAERGDFRAAVLGDELIAARLSPDELAEVFDPAYFLRRLDAVFDRFPAPAGDEETEPAS
jgi:adenylosuccinate lyase